jgi:hypothetical protein
MKTRLPITVLTCAAQLTWAGASKSPSSVEDTQDAIYIENRTIDSDVGEFTFRHGFPVGDTAEELFEFRTFYRGVEVVTENTFAVSMYAMRKAYADAGAGKANQVLVWEERLQRTIQTEDG